VKKYRLYLAKECYTTKLELLTNATVINDAMKFVTRHQNQNGKDGNDKDKDDGMKQKQNVVMENRANEQESNSRR
jgi:hypothetical protein